ncbi:hypothetical protein BG006_002794 [Podila minutissima]|uniref:Uncharacterized protein n=1 Tax=Podila minutissima TaxID=64525 RepID=A0A9P5SVJ2_9FUNG|nr:hypothetical protein BG006_002794 [Podila minutissima]
MGLMAFAMGKEMICPLCRYLHKDQPFMTLEADMEDKLNPSNRRLQQQHHGRALNTQDTLSSHEHPTSGTVLSMMPSFTETFLGPQAGTIQSSGICLKTSTWLLLYALPFSVAVAFLGFVLGQVETLWSKISCMIGSAICYMACWALVVAVMDPDHESRTILMGMERARAHAHDDYCEGELGIKRAITATIQLFNTRRTRDAHNIYNVKFFTTGQLWRRPHCVDECVIPFHGVAFILHKSNTESVLAVKMDE